MKKHQNNNKKTNKKKLRIIDKIFYKIFLSTLVLIGLLVFDESINFNKNINITKFISISSFLLPKEYNNLIDKEVYQNSDYDNLIYSNNINQITNYSFNGVTSLTDGVIVKITKNENELYEVYVQTIDDYVYCYSNLRSFDKGIYSFIKSGTILGSSYFDNERKCYNYEIIISKNKEFFALYEMYENKN